MPQRPRALVSWSGGKDCCLAAHRARQEYELAGLVSMLTEDGSRSRSHGLPPELLQAQASSLQLPLFTAKAAWDTYEVEFAGLLARASASASATHVIFGDVFPDPHKQWAEGVCGGAGLTAIEPLWAEPTHALVYEFIACGDVRRWSRSVTALSMPPGWGRSSMKTRLPRWLRPARTRAANVANSTPTLRSSLASNGRYTCAIWESLTTAVVPYWNCGKQGSGIRDH